MAIRRKYRLHFTVLAWLLIAAIVALTVQPMHLHLQHVSSDISVIHDHVMDLHLGNDSIDPSGHDDSAVFSVTPDVMLKKVDDNFLFAVLFVCLITLVSRVAVHCKKRPRSTSDRAGRSLFSISPPLRAPPLH